MLAALRNPITMLSEGTVVLITWPLPCNLCCILSEHMAPAQMGAVCGYRWLSCVHIPLPCGFLCPA